MRYPATLTQLKLFFVFKPNRLRVIWFTMGVIAAHAGNHVISASQASLPDALDLSKHVLPYSPAPIASVIPDAAETPGTEEKKDVQKAEEKPKPKEKEGSRTLSVREGDTMLLLLQRAGVSRESSLDIVSALRKFQKPSSMAIGQEITIVPTLGKDGSEQWAKPSRIALKTAPDKLVTVTTDAKGNYKASQEALPLKKSLMKASGKIEGSLYEAAVKGGVPASLLGEIIEAYSYDVDFQRDIQRGDKFQVLFERYFSEDGKPVRDGNIVYAQLNLQGEKMTIYRFQTKDGRVDYYDEKGASIRKPLLRTPIDGARISSGFGMRNHPILGYSKMHRGVDFAAPIGTPIYAAGDGVVEFAGAKGGYGNYVMISHNGEYATAYGHISRFGPGIKRGVKVSQRQIVAYVGNTGRSTGPHLHYEVLRNGAQVNPVGVKFPIGKNLKGPELLAFKKRATTLESVFASQNAPKQVADISGSIVVR